MSEIELKACPFCGGREFRDFEGLAWSRIPECRGCGARAMGPFSDVRRNPVDVWNTRASQWQPIESAPKDGTACIGFSPGVGCPILIRWIAPQDFMTTSECERYMDGCADSEVDEAEEWLETPAWWAADFNAGDMLAEDCQPTHWQPLPAPPEVKG
ncbi:Lar family restriction alleviation protein [Stenotrophomonas geniculata]|uniref:Lar family restriction alleviation protein n=1 Tax=Stenotrophomonas geniculata TaxID=86188 RepID=UPI003AAA5315